MKRTLIGMAVWLAIATVAHAEDLRQWAVTVEQQQMGTVREQVARWQEAYTAKHSSTSSHRVDPRQWTPHCTGPVDTVDLERVAGLPEDARIRLLDLLAWIDRERHANSLKPEPKWARSFETLKCGPHWRQFLGYELEKVERERQEREEEQAREVRQMKRQAAMKEIARQMAILFAKQDAELNMLAGSALCCFTTGSERNSVETTVTPFPAVPVPGSVRNSITHSNSGITTYHGGGIDGTSIQHPGGITTYRFSDGSPVPSRSRAT